MIALANGVVVTQLRTQRIDMLEKMFESPALALIDEERLVAEIARVFDQFCEVGRRIFKNAAGLSGDFDVGEFKGRARCGDLRANGLELLVNRHLSRVERERRARSKSTDPRYTVAVKTDVAEGRHADAAALEVQADIKFVSDADTAVHLHRFVADQFKRLAHFGLAALA